MDTRYEAHSFADPLFYDSPLRWGAHEEFPAVAEPPPPGWIRRDRDSWAGCYPQDVELPAQGWKVHVSAGLENAERVLATVRAYCLRDGLPFKFLRGLPMLHLQNAKYAPRAASGKFCTLYPLDDDQLERCLLDLGEELGGESGPYVLSDLRWRQGPLYLRYGAFVERRMPAADGGAQLAFADPHGTLVPDVRAPVFELPPWAPVPAFLRTAVDERRAARSGSLPYRVVRALHFSNAGGIYLAEDPDTGRQLVLKEARPHAGLDQRGTDAVTRLGHEREMLRLLADVPQVPELVDTVTAWEHHFLVQEFVEGETLNAWLAREYPLVHPDPTDTEVADYTERALELLERIEQGLAAIHARGVVFGDLHPQNLMVGADRKVTFLDFELASRTDEFVRPALGAAGFATPGLSGTEVDLRALAALRLWFFLPLQQLLALDPGKAEDLVEAAVRRFRLPAGFAAELRRPPAGPQATSAAARPPSSSAERRRLGALLDTPHPHWPELRDALTAGITATATPQREDRLFPGDIAQFGVDALSLSYGAAGVLYALHSTGAPVAAEHVQWLVDAEARRSPRPGLYTGSHGVAYVLDLLGRPEEAHRLLDRLTGLPLEEQSSELAGGLAGTALTLLHFAHRTGDGGLLAQAVAAGRLLAERQDKDAGRPDPAHDAPTGPTGLLRGASGTALAFLRLHERTGHREFLDRAGTALDQDLARCLTGSDGTLQVPDGKRLLPYLELGSTGIGLVLRDYLEHRPTAPAAAHEEALQRAAGAEFVILPNLFSGRAGLILYLDRLLRTAPTPAGAPGAPVLPAERRAAVAALIERHRRLLTWHLVPYQGHPAFPGEQLLRLSTDLATGSAGVLLALGAALAGTDGLPLLGPTTGAGPATAGPAARP
ncbi:class III lanthionine synthetase LanKC [Kitasatospora nipponensis]|uniref:Class III lanthionine synthetase LanKC n=1 Tax=Kitasatospora nipponensis TaxID=258049 RepID=A0ABN1T8J9_9ACTN